jgi:hypothetical protein
LLQPTLFGQSNAVPLASPWAKARANRIDPLTKPKEIAKVVDRDLLSRD